MRGRPKIVVLRRGDQAAGDAVADPHRERLQPVLEALLGAGMDARGVAHLDERAEATEAQLRDADGVLVWIDPIGAGEDRATVDALLRSVSVTGRFVSAHPEVTAALGTKEVLHTTRHLGWGSDVERYVAVDELREGLVRTLPQGPRVLKPRYGNGGRGVWKVELLGDHAAGPAVRVQSAEHRTTSTLDMPLEAFVGMWSAALGRGEAVISQPFQPGIAEGLIRCYVVDGEVVGFATQAPPAVAPAERPRVLGLPSAKQMRPASDPALARLRYDLETQWIPGLMGALRLTADQLPVLWDADVIPRPTEHGGEGPGFVLCEINCSCVTPFPITAPERIARAVVRRLAQR